MDAEKRSRLKEEECGREISDLRWAVRSSSVMQAPRGDLSSGMLAVTRVLVLKRTCLTGCLQPRQKTILQHEMCTFILVHVSLLVHIVPEANVKMSGTTLLENVQILILSLTCDTKLMFSNHIFFSFGPRGCARVNNAKQPFFSSSQWLRGMKNPTCCASPTASLPSSSPTHTPTLRLRRSRSSSRPPALRWRPCGGRTGTPRRSRLVGQIPSPWITAQMNKRCY